MRAVIVVAAAARDGSLRTRLLIIMNEKRLKIAKIIAEINCQLVTRFKNVWRLNKLPPIRLREPRRAIEMAELNEKIIVQRAISAIEAL